MALERSRGAHGYRVYGVDPRGDRSLYDERGFAARSAFVIGGEHEGYSVDVDERVSIPLSGGVDSLKPTASSLTTSASFGVSGTYVLRLSANDSLFGSADDITITVLPGPSLVLTPDFAGPLVTNGPLAPPPTLNLYG